MLIILSKIKNSAASIICSNFVGKILSKLFRDLIPARRYGKFIYDCSSEFIANNIKASIFWGIYESAEIRFIKQYLRNDLNVIELGASIGVVSTHIINLINRDKRLLVLEANPYLINTLRINLTSNSKFNNYEIINKAISYDQKGEVKLFLGNQNVDSNIYKGEGSFVKPDGIKLSELLIQQNVDAYALICDIEGSEIEILLNEPDYLKKCEQLIIELHSTYINNTFYNTVDMVKLLTGKIGFSLIKNYGEVYYFEK